MNTQFLLAILTATAFFSARRGLELHGSRSRGIAAMLLVSLAVSITGAVAALGDTLYPAPSLAAGMLQDFSPASDLLLRLRLLHPALAIAGGAYIAIAAFTKTHLPRMRGPAFAVTVLAMVQLCAGAFNVVLRAPVWMQIVHLLFADLLWIALVLLLLHSRETERNASSTVSSC